MWDDRISRTPRLWWRLSGALSLRYDARVDLVIVPGPATHRPTDLRREPYQSKPGERSVTHVPADAKKIARYAHSMGTDADASAQKSGKAGGRPHHPQAQEVAANIGCVAVAR